MLGVSKSNVQAAVACLLALWLQCVSKGRAWPLLGLTGSPDGYFRLSVLDDDSCTLEQKATAFYTAVYTAVPLLEMPADVERGRLYALAWNSMTDATVVLELLNAAQGSAVNLTLGRTFPIPPGWTGLSIQLDSRRERLLVAGFVYDPTENEEYVEVHVGAVDLQQGTAGGQFSHLAVLPGSQTENGTRAVFDASNRLLLVPTLRNSAERWDMFYYNWLNVDTRENGRFEETQYFSDAILSADRELVGLFWRVKDEKLEKDSNLTWAGLSSTNGKVQLTHTISAPEGNPVSLVMSHTADERISGALYWALVTHPDAFPWTQLVSVEPLTGKASWSACQWRGLDRPDAIIAWPWSPLRRQIQ